MVILYYRVMVDSNPPDAPDHNAMQPDAVKQQVFSATLTPYRSLGRPGFAFVIVLIGLTSFIAGLLFYRLGAWPVVGFLGLDFLLVWLAFHINFRAARAFEEVSISTGALTIRKVTASGRTRVETFNPAWVRLDIARDSDNLVSAIHVWFRDRAIPVGAFLNPSDRTDFAGAFAAALSAIRGNPA